VVIVLEVLAQLIALREEFWVDYWNILDFVIAMLCVVSLFWTAWNRKEDGEILGKPKEGDDIMAPIVLGIRYTAQLLRMFSLIRRAKKTRDRMKSQKDIEFDACDDGEAPGESVEFSALNEFSIDVPDTPGN